MTSKTTIFTFLALVLAFTKAKAQSSCTNTLMGLSPCLSYVTGNSSAPSPACCSQLSTVVQTAPMCLCSLANGVGANMGLQNINQTLALALPQICNIQSPPLSNCNAVANGPAAGPPASLPTPAPAASPESPSATGDAVNPDPQSEAPAATTPTLPSGGTSSKTVPTSTSDGNIKKPAIFIFFVALGSIVAIF